MSQFDDRQMPAGRICDWPDCPEAGAHRAPRGRDRLDDYWWFCKEHARSYNAQWDYLAGRSADEIADMERESFKWERRTWPLGSRAGQGATWRYAQYEDEMRRIEHMLDSFGSRITLGQKGSRHRLSQADREALDVLSLDPGASLPEVKKRYKELVKRYHPDANSGKNPDPERESRLRETIEAYRHLLASGLFAEKEAVNT